VSASAQGELIEPAVEAGERAMELGATGAECTISTARNFPPACACVKWKA